MECPSTSFSPATPVYFLISLTHVSNFLQNCVLFYSLILTQQDSFLFSLITLFFPYTFYHFQANLRSDLARCAVTSTSLDIIEHLICKLNNNSRFKFNIINEPRCKSRCNLTNFMTLSTIS